MIKFAWGKGKKSKGDQILYIKSKEWSPISYRELARIAARLTKNEQILNHEVPYYTKGTKLLKDYMNYIFNKNWIIVTHSEIDKHLDILYFKHFDKKIRRSN
jgi:hypothetical protein